MATPPERDLGDTLAYQFAQNNQTLRTLIELIPASVLACDVHGTITLRNTLADKILGGRVTGTALGPSQGYTLHFPDGSPFPPDELPLSRAIQRGEATHDVEILVRQQDGQERTILAASQPIRDGAGHIIGAVAIFQDITERRQTLRLLEAREQQQEVVAKIGQEALAGISLSRLFDDAIHLIAQTLNVEFVKVLEILPDPSKLLLRAGIGWRVGLVGHAFVEAGPNSQAGYTLQSEHPVIVEDLRTETRFQGPALLTEHGVVSGISVIIQGQPQPFGILGAHTAHKRIFTQDDINFVQSVANVLAMAIERTRFEAERTRLLAREQALAEITEALVRERELAKVIDVVITQSQSVLGADVVGVWLADPLRREMTMLAFRGKTPAAVEQVETLSFDAPSLSARAAQTEHMQIVPDIASRSKDLPLLRKIALLEGMSSALSLPLHSGGRLVGVITYAWAKPRQFSDEELSFDSTIADLFAVAMENAHIYDLLRQALQVREEFMSAAAHELRTPLTVIKGQTQLLLHTEAHIPSARRALESVDRHVNRITRIVNDLLLTVEVRPGLATLDLKRIDLNALVTNAPSQLRKPTDGRTIRVSAEGPLYINADPKLISEVIYRLIENALRYSPPKGIVEVSARREGNDAVVTVIDHGVGIAVERQPHVFEPFYEAVPPGMPGYVGIADLGLYLSKHIIEAHGGRIWLSNTPGGGSTFSFKLPLAPAVEQPLPSSDSA